MPEGASVLGEELYSNLRFFPKGELLLLFFVIVAQSKGDLVGKVDVFIREYDGLAPL